MRIKRRSFGTGELDGDDDLPLGEGFDPVEMSVDFVKRALLIISEIKLLQDDLKELYAEAKEYDLDVDVIKAVIKRRSKTEAENEQHDNAVSTLEFRLKD